MDKVIGIDLGTSFSCVSVVIDGNPVVIPDKDGNLTTPSVVAFGAENQRLVGWKAKRQAIYNPGNTVNSSKRLIGRKFFSQEVKKAKEMMPYQIVEGPHSDVRIRVQGQDYSLPEIGSFILSKMKQIAEDYLGETVRKAVVTVPAYFNDSQRQATKDAGEIAGLEILRIINEPTAAALAYGYGRDLDKKVVIYDLGGGTFDVSVLDIIGDVFEVVSTAGDTYLGGDDIDQRIAGYMAGKFQEAYKVNPLENKLALQKLLESSENAKIQMSLQNEVTITIPEFCKDSNGVMRPLNGVLTQTKFADLIYDLIQKTFKVCDEALQEARMTAGDIDEVILVGGPTKLPLIRQSVQQYFQKVPQTNVDPDLVVAMGAAIQAAALAESGAEAGPESTEPSMAEGVTGPSAGHVSQNDQPTSVGPKPSSLLIDVTPLSLGIETVGGFTERLIERNSPVPTDQSRIFTTSADNQTQVKIRVYQGESKKAAENDLLGEFELQGLRPAPRGDVKIEVTFELDANGILHVTAKDLETNKQQAIRIAASSGLTREEVQRMKQQAARGVTM
jgi:molecular chaperone DnaK